MKIKILVFAMLINTGLTMASEMFYTSNVYGNCGMCEDRIENTIKELKGVKNAEWNQKNKVLTFSFDNEQTDIYKIHKAIAKAGHDTDIYKARDNSYAKLNACCQYERPRKSGPRIQTYPDDRRVVLNFETDESYNNFLKQQINN
ncbi:heavy-metal-associated domain-containing protein [Carboxylicivirga sediminis]|uniref:Heavy-metal-associated domain-containing protein n=1 Tax=Carboxylicivirga sediminis TaxID=2006564 RepID=A0A941F7G8_9BACT|nr:heavy-metal-associated domain-containing protein [Carboxylicivirga sediminis]MBR8536720.1 heavy-metal-associated domain-containing protein [Carboxylicivirga sediminis]